MNRINLNSRVLLKKVDEDDFHLYNLDTKDEARINKDLKLIVELSSKNQDRLFLINKLKGIYPHHSLDDISSLVNDSIDNLIQWGFLVENKTKNSKLIYIERPNLDYQVEMIYLEVTKLCNLRCNHCYNQSSQDDLLISDQMGLTQYLWVIDELCKKIGPIHYIITGGEPFVRKDIFNLIEYIYKKDVDFSIFTNGTLLGEDKIKQLKQYKPKFVAVSLDGVDNETNKIIRGNDSFYDVINNIKLLTSNGLKVRINTTLMGGVNDTKEEIFKMLYFFDELGVNSVAVCGINQTGRGKNMEGYYLNDNVAAILRDCFSEFNSRNLNEINYNQSFKTSYEKALNMTYCGLGTTTFMVKSNGDIVLCPMLYEDKHKAGNILNDDIVELWNNSSVFNDLRQNPFDSDGGCRECDVKHSCLGGCRATVYEKTGSFIGPDKWFCGFYDKNVTT